jgi:hypothetical protein
VTLLARSAPRLIDCCKGSVRTSIDESMRGIDLTVSVRLMIGGLHPYL